MSRRIPDLDRIRRLFRERNILTLADLKVELGTTSTMTVFRRLKALSYLTSYSHRGRFYTLPELPVFDDLGLWSHEGVYFSRRGNLVCTARHLVDASEMGYTAAELESVAQVEVKHPLLELVRAKAIERRKISGVYVYFSQDGDVRRDQILLREEWEAEAEMGVTESRLAVDEAKAAMILFFSLLDEKQRRLYAGLEAARLGHGGNSKMAGLLGLDSHTVAKGRRELLSGQLERDRVRKRGGGRKAVEKKRPRSSTESEN